MVGEVRFEGSESGPRLFGLEQVSAPGEPLQVKIADPDSFRGLPCVLAQDLGWNADEIRTLELAARLENGGMVRVHFGSGDPPEVVRKNTPPAQIAAFDLFFRTQAEWDRVQRREAAVTLRPGWTGTIDWLALEIRAAHGQVELVSLEATHVDLDIGASPISTGSARDLTDSPAVDAGLIHLRGARGPFDEVRNESERAFPLRSGQPNVVDVEVDGPAVLYGSFARFPGLPGNQIPLHFEVRLEGQSAPLWSLDLDADDSIDLWLPFRAELPHQAAEYRIEFEASTPSGETWCGLLGSPQLHHIGRERRPSLLFITADTLRADHVSALRDHAGMGPVAGLSTPNLDSLAQRGSLFADALSASNATLPSHSSLFTGRTPRDHGVTDNRRRLAPGNFTLGEHLTENGWHTVHASAIEHLNSKDSGLGQGIARYLEAPPSTSAKWPLGADLNLEALTPELQEDLRQQGVDYGVPRAIDELERIGDRPTFLWVHLFDPHTPYVPHLATLQRLGLSDEEQGPVWLASLAEQSLGSGAPEVMAELIRRNPQLTFVAGVRDPDYARSLYAASVSQLDEGLGQLFAAFEARGNGEDLIAFTSDHGESLGERGVWFDHSGAYQNTLQVPLILSGAGVPRGAVFDNPVSSLDLAAGLCDLLGAPSFDGENRLSFVDLFAGRSLAPGPRWFQHARNRQVGFRDGDQHWVWNRERFRLGVTGEIHEPNTLQSLRPASKPSGVEARLGSNVSGAAIGEQIETWLADRSQAFSAEKAARSSAAESALQALGYAGDDADEDIRDDR